MFKVEFSVDSAELSDESKVFDVVLIDQDGDRQPLFNAPSERTARLTADALNDVLKAFMLCGSDYEALKLAGRLIDACKFKI